MRSHLPRATLLATVVMAAAVTTADATTMSLVVNTFRAVWNPVVFEAAGLSVSCALTLEGSFAEHTFAKTSRLRIGSVTRASMSGCSEGSATVLTASLPWTVQYASFARALPAITSMNVNLVGASVGITPRGSVECLARTEEAEPLVGVATRNATGELTGLRAEEASGIRLSGGFLCTIAGRGHLSGTGRLTRAGEERAGLVLLLGTHGTALAGATAEETGGADGIADLTIRPEMAENSRGIRNTGIWYQNRVRSIHTVGGDNTRFVIPNEEMNACRPSSEPEAEDGTVLPVGGASCNVRVRPTGTRPLNSTVEITYVYGALWNKFITESFTVRAE